MTYQEAVSTNDIPRETTPAVPSSPEQEASAPKIIPAYNSPEKNKNTNFHGPDLLTLLLLAVFLINLGAYLNCQHKNLALIAARDSRQNHRQRHQQESTDQRDSNTAERERIRRGEMEQVMHAPTEKHVSGMTDELLSEDNAPESADASNENQGKQSNQRVCDENGIDEHWLASMMYSGEAKIAIAELEKQKGELKLTEEQKELISRLYFADYTKDFKQKICDVLSDLTPKQTAYLATKMKDQHQQGENFDDSAVQIDEICAKLEQVKKTDGAYTPEKSTNSDSWGPNQLVQAINMLIDCQDESCQLTKNQAKLLIDHLRALKKAIQDIHSNQAHTPLPSTVLNDKQIIFLNTRIKELHEH